MNIKLTSVQKMLDACSILERKYYLVVNPSDTGGVLNLFDIGDKSKFIKNFRDWDEAYEYAKKEK